MKQKAKMVISVKPVRHDSSVMDNVRQWRKKRGLPQVVTKASFKMGGAAA